MFSFLPSTELWPESHHVSIAAHFLRAKHHLFVAADQQAVRQRGNDRSTRQTHLRCADRWTILRVPGLTLFSIFAFGPHPLFPQAAPALYPSACEADEYFAPAFHEEFRV